MSAQIIAFPTRKRDFDLETAGTLLRASYDVPARDAELALLIQIGESLLSNMSEPGCDRFLDRLDAWEVENRSA